MSSEGLPAVGGGGTPGKVNVPVDLNTTEKTTDALLQGGTNWKGEIK